MKKCPDFSFSQVTQLSPCRQFLFILHQNNLNKMGIFLNFKFIFHNYGTVGARVVVVSLKIKVAFVRPTM